MQGDEEMEEQPHSAVRRGRRKEWVGLVGFSLVL